MVEHIVWITDPDTTDGYVCRQAGYNALDVENRVAEALAPGSGNLFEGMNAVIDPFPFAESN